MTAMININKVYLNLKKVAAGRQLGSEGGRE